MKSKKFIISLVSCVLVFAVCFGLYSQNKAAKDVISVALLDAATTKDGVIYPEETEIVEVEEEETPAAGGTLVVGGNTSTRNLNTSELDKIRTKLISKVNSERKTGASNITVSDTAILKTTGNVRAKEIVSKWSHTRPNGKEWETVLSQNGVNMTNIKAGEDLAQVTLSAKGEYSDSYIDQVASTIHTSLMNSPTHKAVILNKDYKQVGVGLYSEVKNGKVTVYVTEHFKNDNAAAKKATTTKVTAPKAPTSLKVTAAKKSAKVSYKKATGATGYEIAYSLKKTSGFKTTTTTAASKAISKLTSKKTYYVKVRAYKTVSGKKYYSPYTAVKSVKVK